MITSTMTVRNFKKAHDERDDEKIEMMKKMEGMKFQELKAMYNKMEMMGKEEEEESVKVDESTLDERLASVDVSDDVSALTQDEELSEEFKGQRQRQSLKLLNQNSVLKSKELRWKKLKKSLKKSTEFKMS